MDTVGATLGIPYGLARNARRILVIKAPASSATAPPDVLLIQNWLSTSASTGVPSCTASPDGIDTCGANFCPRERAGV